MPIYAFECTSCGHSFDKLQKLSDPDPEICPSCGEASIKRQLTAPAFRLAGSGWYETDFKKDGDKKRNLVESGDSAAKPEAASSESGKPASSEASSKPEAAKPAPAPAPAAAKPAAGDA